MKKVVIFALVYSYRQYFSVKTAKGYTVDTENEYNFNDIIPFFSSQRVCNAAIKIASHNRRSVSPTSPLVLHARFCNFKKSC